MTPREESNVRGQSNKVGGVFFKHSNKRTAQESDNKGHSQTHCGLGASIRTNGRVISALHYW